MAYEYGHWHVWLPEPEMPPFYYCRVCRVPGQRNLKTGEIEVRTRAQVAHYFEPTTKPKPRRAEKRAGVPVVTEDPVWLDEVVRLPLPLPHDCRDWAGGV